MPENLPLKKTGEPDNDHKDVVLIFCLGFLKVHLIYQGLMSYNVQLLFFCCFFSLIRVIFNLLTCTELFYF